MHTWLGLGFRAPNTVLVLAILSRKKKKEAKAIFKGIAKRNKCTSFGAFTFEDGVEDLRTDLTRWLLKVGVPPTDAAEMVRCIADKILESFDGTVYAKV